MAQKWTKEGKCVYKALGRKKMMQKLKKFIGLIILRSVCKS